MGTVWVSLNRSIWGLCGSIRIRSYVLGGTDPFVGYGEVAPPVAYI